MGKIEDGEKHFKYMHALYKIVKKMQQYLHRITESLRF